MNIQEVAQLTGEISPGQVLPSTGDFSLRIL